MTESSRSHVCVTPMLLCILLCRYGSIYIYVVKLYHCGYRKTIRDTGSMLPVKYPETTAVECEDDIDCTNCLSEVACEIK